MITGGLKKLNPAQRLAATYGVGEDSALPGPLLIIAGAGSGKTNTLAHRVAHLIASGADPRRLLLLTFSRRAAVEMGRRVERIVASMLGHNSAVASAALTWSGTFHAIGARLLREHAEQLGISPDFTIHDREDSADLINLVRHELGFSQMNRRFPTKGTCMQIYSRVVNTELSLDEVMAQAFPWCQEWEVELTRLFAAYVEAKQGQNVLDYDDLLLYWAQAVAVDKIASAMGGRFDHVLVDEYQDTNRLQSSILLAMKPDGRGVTVVGDDAQSIYSFRAATVRNILEFPASFDPPAEVVTLKQNYRSVQPILDAANAVIELVPERFTKNLWSDRHSSELPRLISVANEQTQAECVVEQVLANRECGMLLKEQAVLFRAASHSAFLELELARRNIPFVKFGGLKFLETAHVKDVLACLKWAENPRDRVTGFRVLQLIPGIGPKSAGGLLNRFAQAARSLEVLRDCDAPAGAQKDWPAFAELIERLHVRAPGWPAEFNLVRQWYQPHLERIHEDAAIRAADLVQLEHIAASYPSRQKFLTELTLDPPEATSDEAGVPLLDEDYLILSTIHSAKGLEWKAVFVLNAVDGCIPSDMATGTSEELDEERRLLYVAMTRAKDHLSIFVPHRFYVHRQSSVGDMHVYATRTRFIPDSALPLFHVGSWRHVDREPESRTATTTARVDLAARMRGMWR